MSVPIETKDIKRMEQLRFAVGSEIEKALDLVKGKNALEGNNLEQKNRKMLYQDV